MSSVEAITALWVKFLTDHQTSAQVSKYTDTYPALA